MNVAPIETNDWFTGPLLIKLHSGRITPPRMHSQTIGPLDFDRRVTSAELQALLPRMDDEVLQTLTKRLSATPFHLLDLGSFACKPSPSASTNMECAVTIVDNETREEVKHNQIADEMHCYAMLPNDAGVELRGNHTIYFRAAKQEDVDRIIAETKKRTEDIAHCKKLLIDLPVALTNSKTAMNAAMDDLEQNDFSDIGAMALEQRRLKQEIESQKKQLVELEASPVPEVDPSMYQAFTFCGRALMPFGISNLYGIQYHLLRKGQSLEPIPKVEVDCVQINPAVNSSSATATALSSSTEPMALDA